MEKNLEITVLLDFYGELLTEKQVRALTFYYDEDCSLSEIAEDMCVSRQGARDFIKRGEAQLYEFEQKLGLVARFAKISRAIDELLVIAEGENAPERLRALIKEIKDNL